MSSLVLVDTSVLLNVLDVPGRNEHRETILEEFQALILSGDSLFLPMAAVVETGNHIAQIKTSGQIRREVAERFVETVRAALRDEAPWKPMSFPGDAQLLAWLDDFPEHAMRQIGMGDLSIVKAWEQLCERFPMSEVRVWTVDGDLAGYRRQP